MLEDSQDTLVSEGGTHVEANDFFHEVARALDKADEIRCRAFAVNGVRQVHAQEDHSYDPRTSGVETVDHPNDQQLAGYAKLYFTDGGPRRMGNGSGYRETIDSNGPPTYRPLARRYSMQGVPDPSPTSHPNAPHGMRIASEFTLFIRQGRQTTPCNP